MMPLVSGLLFRCLYHLFSSPFFWGKKMQEDKYPLNLISTEKDNQKFLLIQQGDNKVYIPFHKIKKTLAGIQFILEDMEIENGEN
jgi:hypothetical protein